MLITRTKRIAQTIRKMFFFLFLISSAVAFSQQPVLEFSTLNAFENISNLKTNAIAQDSVGYLWIATEEGLFRFDGQTLFSYKKDDNDHYSLPSNRINKIFVTHDGNIWVSTSEGLCKYNPEFDNFLPIVVQSNLRGVAGMGIGLIAEDKTNQIYITYANLIYKYNPSQNLFSKVLELKQGNATAMIFDDQNNIWIAASNNGGLYYYNQKTQQLTTFFHNPNNKQSISSNQILDIALVEEKLWIATDGGGIDSYNIQNKTFKHYIGFSYFENYAISIFADRNKNIWISTLGGLKLFDPLTDTFFNYYSQPNNPKSLGKNLRSFYEDNQGNYWTVHSPGQIRISRYKNKFEHFSNNSESFWHTSEKDITCISVDKESNLWVGNYYNGIDVFNLGKQKTDRYFHKENDPKSLGNASIFSIYHDSKHQMWVGSYLGGLQKFNPETKSFESYTNNPSDTQSIAINDVRSISEDANGNLWLAVQGKGIDRFDIKRKTFHHFTLKNNLSSVYTFQVLNDSRENLWVATSWGLNLLRKGESNFINFLYNRSDSTTINSNYINTIHEDRQHNIWIGTPEGLNKFDFKTQTFVRYSAGLENKYICSILSDQKNNIWVSTHAGISKFDHNDHRFTNFNQIDGLLSKEFIDRSCYIDDHNKLFFGGSEGIDFFYPDSLLIGTKRPSVILSDFKLFNKSISNKTDTAIIQKHISYAKKIVLNYKSNSFTFIYQTINFTNPEKITYAFKLDGFDQNWIYAGTKREASYTNLDPGKYTFRVKAKYDNEDWSKKETTIELIIVPVWWMTIWFRILMVFIVLTLIFGIVFLRIKRLSNQRKKLEILVAERTNEIQSKNDQLRALNSTKDKLFSIISHDLRSPFNSILGFQDLLLNNYYDLSDTDRLEMISQVHSTTNQVYYLVENLLNWARMQSNSIQHHPVKFKLNKVINEKLYLYQQIAEGKGITLNYQFCDGLVAFADINLLETTLRNLINNAIKFTPGGGNILVKTESENDVIKISVVDSGTGMTQEQINDLFNLEKTNTTAGTNGEEGSGLGLLLCKEFVEKNQGSITIESQLEKGSTFSFTIPAYSHK